MFALIINYTNNFVEIFIFCNFLLIRKFFTWKKKQFFTHLESLRPLTKTNELFAGYSENRFDGNVENKNKIVLSAEICLEIFFYRHNVAIDCSNFYCFCLT